MTIESPHDPKISSVSTSLELDHNEAIKRSLKFEQRPWRTHSQYPCRRGSESKQHDMSFFSKGCLPKGVVRGCVECNDCQKVSARWDPKGACSCIVEEAPVFHPHEEEFKDTFKYIDSIRRQVEPYGLCRIIPPPSWQSSCFLEEDNIWQNYKFPTKIQRVNELRNHCSSEKDSVAHDTRDPKRRKLDYEFGDGCAANFISNEFCEEESSQSAFGPQFTLIAFKRYADQFKQQYFSRDDDLSNPNTSPVKNQKKYEPSEVNIEGEYWRIIEKPTAEIDVLSATDLDQKVFGDGFSVSSNRKQETDLVENDTSGWNLSNISRLPGSLLSLDTLDSSSHFAHRLHVGMCFSSLPWNVEEHCLYQLHYLHLGAPRIWYGIPASDSYTFEAAQKKQFPNLSKEHLKTRHSMGRQLSPATLKSEDVHVYRCIQRPREFVLFLPGAYHSGFDCGFNFSASAVFAPFDWLLHGLTSVELYSEQRRKTLISFDRMLLRAANEVVKAQWEPLFKARKTLKILAWKKASGKDGILARVLRMRIRSLERCRKYLSLPSQSRKMDMSFYNDNEKRECSTCYYHLYLSAVNCPCSPNKFSCLKHAKNLCLCPWTEKIFLFRFTTSELEILAEAVEGKVTAIRRWVKEDLGSALYKDNKPSKPEPTKDPCLSIIEGSRVPSEEDKGCALVADRDTSNGSSEANTSSSSSSDMDIDAYLEALTTVTRGKLSKTVKSEAEVDNAPRDASVFEKGNTCQIGNVICLSDDDDD